MHLCTCFSEMTFECTYRAMCGKNGKSEISLTALKLEQSGSTMELYVKT